MSKQQEGAVTLSTGVRAIIHPVGASLIEDVTAKVKMPRPPTIMNEDKGRTEENPFDPDYLDAVREAKREQSMAAVDAMLMFGLELVDGLPDNDWWLRNLKYLNKLHPNFGLDGYDLEDPFIVEFLYKKYIATGTQDLIMIGKKAGLNQADVEEAASNFQDN